MRESPLEQRPHQVAAEWSDRYKGKFDAGWDVARELRRHGVDYEQVRVAWRLG